MTQPTIPHFNEIWRHFPHTFARKMSGGKWLPFPYLKLISVAIAEAVYGGGGQLIIELPPRHGKSEKISFWTPHWYLDQFPERKVILTSYEADFAAGWGRRVRNEIENNPLSRVEISDDSAAANRWETTEGGGMITAGVGGPIVGRGGHLLVIDDPVKNWAQSISETYQKATIDWFKSTFWTRREPGAVVVVLMQRWNEKDLVGFLTSDPEHAGKWKRITLPALSLEGDLLNRKYGEALCPQRYSAEYLQAMRREIGTHMFEALFQQKPSPDEGEIFKRQWWKYWKVLPEKFDTVIQSWDLTFKDSQMSDFVVGTVWGKKGADKYLLDMVRKRMSFTATLESFKALTEKWPGAKAKLVEDAANGAALVDTLNKKISGIIPVRPMGSKIARAMSVSPQVESGNVYLPDPTIHKWTEDVIEECAVFPNGRNDDIVDSMTQALTRLQNTLDMNFSAFGLTGTSKWVK